MRRLLFLALYLSLFSAAAPEPTPRTQKLPDSSAVGSLPFSQQAVAFLNTYWNEVGTEAEYIYRASWETTKRADMRAKGVILMHQYAEGTNLDFDMSLYVLEQLAKLSDDPNSKWVTSFPRSQPGSMTALARKQELRGVADTNSDGRISFAEYLVYQYRDSLGSRKIGKVDEDPDVKKARLELAKTDKFIRDFETEKTRLENDARQTGTKGLAARNALAHIATSPAGIQLKKSLNESELVVNAMTKRLQGNAALSQSGAVWWYNRDVTEKKKRYAL